MPIKIQDESGDKEFFTIIPNYIANHSTANDQALYFQMKRYAGEDGKCFATEKTLMSKMGIGKKAYDKSLNYLLSKGWISFVGLTGGKTRPIKTYKINNIWKLNIEHYRKISAESTLSFKEISAESEGDKSQKQHKISAESNVEEEPYKEEPITRDGSLSASPPLKEKIPLKELTDLYLELYKQFYPGNEPIVNWVQCGKLAVPFIKKLGIEKMKELLRIYFNSNDKFYLKVGHSFNNFLTASTIHSLLNGWEEEPKIWKKQYTSN